MNPLAMLTTEPNGTTLRLLALNLLTNHLGEAEKGTNPLVAVTELIGATAQLEAYLRDGTTSGIGVNVVMRGGEFTISGPLTGVSTDLAKATTAASGADITVTPVKKTRRPRKTTPAADTEPAATPRRRGPNRPKTTTPADTTTPVKRGPGRPRKQVPAAAEPTVTYNGSSNLS